LAEAAGLPAAFEPAATLVLIQQARQRCPAESRLVLTTAILTEQQWPLRPLPLLPGDSAPTADAAREREVSQLYEAAAQFPGNAAEAQARAAWFYTRLRRLDRAEEWINRITLPPADPRVRYLVELIRGEVWRALGRTDAAVVALRAAMAVFPGGTAARMALMTTLMATDHREEAESLAIAEESASNPPFDPWWGYWLGDFVQSPGRLSRLRELTR
jgi:predicted Zn-dependent protease